MERRRRLWWGDEEEMNTSLVATVDGVMDGCGDSDDGKRRKKKGGFWREIVR